MLEPNGVHEIWRALDEAGTTFVALHGQAKVDLRETVKEVLSDVSSLTRGRYTREEILEAWLYQSLAFMHEAAKTGRFAKEG